MILLYSSFEPNFWRFSGRAGDEKKSRFVSHSHFE